MKLFKTFFLTMLLLQVNIVYAIPVIKALSMAQPGIDMLVTKGFKRVLSKESSFGVELLSETMGHVVKSLHKKGRWSNSTKFIEEQLKKRVPEGSDEFKKLFDPVDGILYKDINELSQSELNDLVNITAKYSGLNTNQKYPLLVCEACTDQALVDAGFNYVLKEATGRTKRALVTIPSPGSKDFHRFMTNMSIKHKLSDEAKKELTKLSDVGKKNALVALKKLEVGTPAEKELMELIVRQGKPNQYGIVISGMDDVQLQKWIALLKDNKEDKNLDLYLREFFESKAAHDPQLEENLRLMKLKDCWGLW